MPPRNSMTKAFRKYHYVQSPNAQKIPIEKIYDTILKPQNAIGNELESEFEKYKAARLAQGLDLTSCIDEALKADDDGDPRYINKQWYKERATRGVNE